MGQVHNNPRTKYGGGGGSSGGGSSGTPGSPNYNPGKGAKNVLVKTASGVHSGTVDSSGKIVSIAGQSVADDEGPSTLGAAVAAEQARLALKYPGYVASETSTENIRSNILKYGTPYSPMNRNPVETAKYPGYAGKGVDEEGNLHALAQAQQQGYYEGGKVASSAGPMPGRMQDVVSALHERTRTEYGGGMAGENVPGDALVREGAERLFQNVADRIETGRTGKTPRKYDYSGASEVVRAQEAGLLNKDFDLDTLESGAKYTLTETPTQPQTREEQAKQWREGGVYESQEYEKDLAAWKKETQKNLGLSVEGFAVGYPKEQVILGPDSQNGEMLKPEPKSYIYPKGLPITGVQVHDRASDTDIYTKPGLGADAFAAYGGAGMMTVAEAQLIRGAFKVSPWVGAKVAAGVAFTGAVAGEAAKLLGEGAEKLTKEYLPKALDYVPESLKEPTASSVLTIGAPGMNTAIYYANKFSEEQINKNFDKVQKQGGLGKSVIDTLGITKYDDTIVGRTARVNKAGAEAAGFIGATLAIGPAVISAAIADKGGQIAANRMSLNFDKLEFGGTKGLKFNGGGDAYVAYIAKGEKANILGGVSGTKVFRGEPKVTFKEGYLEGALKGPRLTKTTSPEIEQAYFKSVEEAVKGTDLQKMPKGMVKESVNFAEDVRAFKGQPEQAKALKLNFQQNKDAMVFGSEARKMAGAKADMAGDVDRLITSQRSSVADADRVLGELNAVGNRRLQIGKESPSLITDKSGAHIVDIHGADSAEIQSGVKLNKKYFAYGYEITDDAFKVEGVKFRELYIENRALRGAASMPQVRELTPYTPAETKIFTGQLKAQYEAAGGVYEPVGHRLKDVGNLAEGLGRSSEVGKSMGKDMSNVDANIAEYKRTAEVKFTGAKEYKGLTQENMDAFYRSLSPRKPMPSLSSASMVRVFGNIKPSSSPSRGQSSMAAPSISSRTPSKSPSTSPYSRLLSPSFSPSKSQSRSPSFSPSMSPSRSPSRSPSKSPSFSPSKSPSTSPSSSPSWSPSRSPSPSPSPSPSLNPYENYLMRGLGGGFDLGGGGGKLPEMPRFDRRTLKNPWNTPKEFKEKLLGKKKKRESWSI